MSEKHKKTCKYLNYIKHLLILASTINGCVLISAFASLVCVPVGITSSAVGLKICAITAGSKKYQKQKYNHDEAVMLGKTKLDPAEVVIFKALIDSYISNDQIVLVNNVLREYNEMKEEIKYPETFV